MLKKIIGIVLVAFILVGCVRPQAYVSSYHYVSPKTLGSFSEGRLADFFSREGVILIQRGDYLRIVLPTDIFFKDRTPQIRPCKAILLAYIARLLIEYNDCIDVVGYTDNIGPEEKQYQRSYDYAHSVAAYLWSSGIPLSRMVIHGSGEHCPIANNHSLGGSAMNRRVEITVSLTGAGCCHYCQ